MAIITETVSTECWDLIIMLVLMVVDQSYNRDIKMVPWHGVSFQHTVQRKKTKVYGVEHSSQVGPAYLVDEPWKCQIECSDSEFVGRAGQPPIR